LILLLKSDKVYYKIRYGTGWKGDKMWIELKEKELFSCFGGGDRDKRAFFDWLIDLFK